MRLPIFVAFALLAGCGTSSGFGVDVTLRFDASVSDSQLAEVSAIVVTASGDEDSSFDIALGRLAQRVERFVYRPKPTSKHIGLAVVGQTTAAGVTETLASGDDRAITLSSDSLVGVTIVLSAPMVDAGVDLSRSLDVG